MTRDGETDLSVSNIHVTRFEVAGSSHLPTTFNRSTTPGADGFILYTSGSTGEPKGAVHSQSDLFYTNETFCREVLRLREGDRLFYIVASAVRLRPGQRVHVSAAERIHDDPVSWKPTPESSRVSSAIIGDNFFGVPVVYRMLLNITGMLRRSTLRACVCASRTAKRCPRNWPEDWQRALGVEGARRHRFD